MSETEEIANLVIKASGNMPAAIITTPDGREFTAHRDDVVITETTPPNVAPVVKPKIVTQAVVVQDQPSFVEYVNRFQNPDSVIFADISNNRVLGVIDYHHQPQARATGEIKDETPNAEMVPAAELCKHSVLFAMPFSLEWSTWMAQNGKLLSHKEFATFMEENAIDVLPLPKRDGLATSEADADMPETLLELTRSLQVTNKVQFNSVVRHGDYDRIEFQKESEATAKGAIGLPVSFQIYIPVYFGEPPVVMTCFTRKKITDDGLRLGFAINRAENARQDEFKRIVSYIAGQTTLTTLYGKPSA